MKLMNDNHSENFSRIIGKDCKLKLMQDNCPEWLAALGGGGSALPPL